MMTRKMQNVGPAVATRYKSTMNLDKGGIQHNGPAGTQYCADPTATPTNGCAVPHLAPLELFDEGVHIVICMIVDGLHSAASGNNPSSALEWTAAQ